MPSILHGATTRVNLPNMPDRLNQYAEGINDSYSATELHAERSA